MGMRGDVGSMGLMWRPPTRGLERSGSGAVWRASLVTLAIGLLLVDRYEWLATPNRLVGAVVVCLGLVVASRRKAALPRELLLFGAFIVWAGAAGYAVAEHPDAVTSYLRLLAQVWALGMGVAAYAWLRGNADDIFWVLVLLAWILAAFVLFVGYSGIEVNPGGRATSFLMNPNALGIFSLWGLMGVAWLWPTARSSLRLRLLLAGSVPAFILMIVLSASRKSFIALVVFAVLWYTIAYTRGSRGWPVRIAGALVLAVMGYFAFSVLLPGSTMETRLRQARATPRLDADRANLYDAGFKLFLEQPITGVGLGNYLYRSGTGEYAHSDSMEVLSTTGLVGLLLYFSVYPSLVLRIRRLLRRLEGRKERYSLGLCLAILVAELVLGLGVPLFLMPFPWMILAGIAGMLGRWEGAVKYDGPTSRARIGCRDRSRRALGDSLQVG